MAYDFTSSKDLVQFVHEQLNKPTKYVLGEIGRYYDGIRTFDCVGLIKCFLWHDYRVGNASWYKVTCPDINANQMYQRATEKGAFKDIPEIPGLLVWLSGHIGVYIGNGEVIEATSSFGDKVVKTQFKDKTKANYRNSWTHWLKCPFLNYEEGNQMTQFINGYQKVNWSGQLVHVYKQKKDQEIGLMSTPNYKQLQTIDKIDNDLVHFCKVNCSYFVMSGTEKGQVLGREQGFTQDSRPEQKEWLDVVVTNENRIACGDLASWEYPKDQLKCGYSPACIVLKDGIDVELISSAVGSGKYSTANTQTLHMQDAECTHYFAVVAGKLNGKQCRDFAKAYGMTFCAMMDSGGSSQMRADGKSILYTGRALPNVLTFYKKDEATPTPEPTEPTPEEPETPSRTRWVKCVKGTHKDGIQYPTRASATSAYSFTPSIKVGDTIRFDLGTESKNANKDVCLRICESSRPELIGRWFAYDFDYFK